MATNRRLLSPLPATLALIFATALPNPVAAHNPPFFWMADMSADRRVGIDLGFGTPQVGTDNNLAHFFGVNAHVAVTPAIILFAELPLALVFFDDNDPVGPDDDAAGALGNINFGGRAVMRRRLGRDSVMRLGGSIGVYLPTASDSGSAGVAAAAVRQLFLPNQGLWVQDATSLRHGGDIRFDFGQFFLQSELNLDLAIRDGEDDVDLVFGVGPGVTVTSHLAFLLELTIVEISDDSTATLDFGLRYHLRSLMMGARVYLPLEDIGTRDVFALGFDVAARF